ncbi:hypothetical protein GTA08_BOTSDO04595 [Neofusicoccum parvum]|nr:hypothetical protein GTA08_BOTSDO04595 [Neofusicoccum parvum]
MRQPNFEQCGKDYMANATAQALYGWRGPVIGIAPNNQSQITTEGCKILCGTYSDYYPWSLASSTITTWILPVVGILLQAPFESNAFSHTILAIARWVGSPMASLAYILWNIKVSAKCALMVDMATRCDEPIPDEQSHFSSIRDSFYILMTMNQYTMRRSEALNKEAEGLLRIVLFSKDLQLRGKDGKEKRLNKVRQDLAHKLRAAPDDIRKKLNKLIDIVCKSLQDEEIREDFIGTFEGQPECKRMEAWVRRISEQSKYMQDFFVDFAGQGRVRWHYGAAHPILSDIEDCYVTRHGRGWLANEAEARMHLVLGGVDEGLLWFDFRELWQIGSGMLIVGGTCFGAFILSYYTPTIEAKLKRFANAAQHLFIKATLPILRSAGTAVGTAIMSFGMMYVVSEWCQQSHLSTENYAAAARGLHRTRAYRRLTYQLRLAWRTLEAATFLLLKAVLVTVFRRPGGPRADNSVRWTPDGASPRVPSFGSSTTTGGGSDGGAAMLGVTPSIQLEEWTDAHLHHSPPRHRTHDRYRSISLDTDPLSTADSLRFSPPYFPGSRSRSRSRGESDASSRALLGGYSRQEVDAGGSREWGLEAREALDTASLAATSEREVDRSVELLGVGAGLGVRPVYLRQRTDDEGGDGRGER